MFLKIHGTNFFHIQLLERTHIKCQNGPVLPPAQVFYFNGQALTEVLSLRHTEMCLEMQMHFQTYP
jgi:hypothetical protein